MKLTPLINRCIEEMRTAAIDTYLYDYRPYFTGCSADVVLLRPDGEKAYILIDCDAFGRHTVAVEGRAIGPLPLLGAYIALQLDRCADEEGSFNAERYADEQAAASEQRYILDLLQPL